MAKRLIKVAKEIQQSTHAIVTFLKLCGYKIENKPTVKITDEMYEKLVSHFRQNPDFKNKKTKKKEFESKNAPELQKITIKKKKIINSLSPKKMDMWKAFIEAQDIITSQYSQPFLITYLRTENDVNHYFRYSEDPSRNIRKKIKETFIGIEEQNIHLKQGFFLYQISLLNRLSNYNLESMQKYCYSNFYDFVPKPCITGIIRLKESPFQLLGKKLFIEITTEGECFATLNQIKTIDQTLIQFSTLKRIPNIGAISKVSAGEPLINKHYQRVSRYLKEEVGLEAFEAFGVTKNLIIKNSFLKPQHIDWIAENTFYRALFHRIVISIDKTEFEKFQKERKKRRIFFHSENSSSRSGIILPDPINNEFHFIYDREISLLELRFEIFFRSKSFETYFDKTSFSVKHEHVLKVDNQVFLEYIKDVVPHDLAHVSTETETISFDFRNLVDLNENLKKLGRIEEIYCLGFNEDHRYKVKFEYDSPLKNVAETLQEIPSVQIHFEAGGTMLNFMCYFENIEEVPQLKALLFNRFNKIGRGTYHFSLDNIKNNYVRYSINFRKEEFKDSAQKQLQYLKGEELVNQENEQSQGILTKIQFPEIILSTKMPITKLQEKIIVYGALKGEKDKIKRLNDSIKAIFDEHEQIENPKLKTLLVDPSNADTSNGDILKSYEYSEVLNFVNQELLTPKERINNRQIEAVTKSLISNDLFVIQGPPGTGKSTAIAEIIWQHIRDYLRVSKNNNYKILVTSETNLAVDNALDKLRSKNHTLIKPIRFGSEEKLDKEGKRFSLENLQNWVNTELEGSDNDGRIIKVNIIEDWIKQIAQRANNFSDEKTKEVILDWITLLIQPELKIRQLFFDIYTQYTNVVGATCSSIGKLSSTGKKTRFFKDYLGVYFPDEPYHSSFQQQISFDLVIQDEASKASPPELALPCIYAKKAIIIGDHKQLPPMIDTNEFIENLEYLKNQSRSNQNWTKIDDLIRIVNRNRDSFEKSHFENLFKSIPANLKTTFNYQYRMHPAINETIKQFYLDDGGLECGLIKPFDLGVDESDLNNFASRYHGFEIEGLLDENTHVLWVNTDSPEQKKGTSRINLGELEAIRFLISKITKSKEYQNFISFWKHSYEEKQIGIITFYGAQASLLKELKREFSEISLRISPVDRFQGMERNIIIVSTVRSNCICEFPNQKPDYNKYKEFGYPKQDSLGFAEFPNRLNVALSRAKRLLIIVGNATHFSKKSIYENVITTIKNHPNGRLLNYSEIKN